MKAQKNQVINKLKSVRDSFRVLEMWLGASWSGPLVWRETHKVGNNWREDVEMFAKELPRRASAKLKICALSHDGPGWLLCRTKEQATGGSLLVCGAGWGRQMELLQDEFCEITIIEKKPAQAEFLKARFRGCEDGVNICLLSDLGAVKEICIAKSFAAVFIRGDFIREWSKAEIESVLSLLCEHLPPSAEFIIETWEIDPAIERIASTFWAEGFQSKKGIPPTRSWWKATLDQIFEGESRLYRVQGPHWCAQAYMPWRGRLEQRTKAAPRNYFNLSRYAERLGTLVHPAAVLMVHSRSLMPKVAIVDDIVATNESTDAAQKPNGYRVSGRGTAMVWPVKCGPVLRIPLTPQARARCEIAHNAIQKLHQQLPAELKSVLSMSSHRVYSSTISAYSELLMPGTPGEQILSREMNNSALDWLANLHAHTMCMVDSPDSAAGRVLQNRIAQLVEVGDIILEKHSACSQQALWSRLKETLLNPPWESGIALCMTHGDFHIGNLLFSKEKLSGVIDWETAASPALPIRDLIWFALSCTIVGQHATAEVYERDLLGPKLPLQLSVYSEIVGTEIWRSIWHPWCRIVYPLERLKTVWDGYELAGVVKPSTMAEDWINLVAPLAKFQEREGLLRRSR